MGNFLVNDERTTSVSRMYFKTAAIPVAEISDAAAAARYFYGR
jgi:hypothetical protein